MKLNLKNLCHKTGYKISQHKPLYIQRPDFMNSEKKLNQFYFELGQADSSDAVLRSLTTSHFQLIWPQI